MANGSDWPNIYCVSGSRDALMALVDIAGFSFDEHGQHVLDDGTLSCTAYATDAAAAIVAGKPGVEITLIRTGADIANNWLSGGGGNG